MEAATETHQVQRGHERADDLVDLRLLAHHIFQSQLSLGLDALLLKFVQDSLTVLAHIEVRPVVLFLQQRLELVLPLPHPL